MLALLDDIKTRLDIDAADVSMDDDLTAILETASEKILSLCRYSENADEIVEIVRNVQQGREYRTKTRLLVADSGTPDVAVFKAEGRGHGSSFQQLAVDVLDSTDGVWMILGSSEWWPPNYVEERRPRFRRWREPIWPVVKLTYGVVGVGDPAPRELSDAAVSLAIHWLTQSKSGAITDVQIGQLKQSISDAPVPSHVKAMLGSTHYRQTGATWAR